MTWAATETSEESARRIELYTFTVGATVTRYTNSSSNYISGSTWAAIPIDRSAVRRNANPTDSGLDITLPGDAAIPALFLTAPPPSVVQVQVQAVHPHDGEISPIYSGRVLSCEWVDGGAQARLECRAILSEMKKPGRPILISKQCRHVLYSTGHGNCQATKSGVTVTVSAIGNPVTLTTTPAGDYKGGLAEFANGEVRLITYHSGNQLTLLWGVSSLEINDTFDIFKGCNHNLEACGTFSNTNNYGGFPFMPEKDPSKTVVF